MSRRKLEETKGNNPFLASFWGTEPSWGISHFRGSTHGNGWPNSAQEAFPDALGTIRSDAAANRPQKPEWPKVLVNTMFPRKYGVGTYVAVPCSEPNAPLV